MKIIKWPQTGKGDQRFLFTSYNLLFDHFIFAINYYLTYWEYQWFWFPLMGWGIGLGVQWLAIFAYGSKWEEKNELEILEKEEKLNKKTNNESKLLTD